MPKAPAPKGGKTKINLKQKVGPLPLWGWGVVAIIAYYVYSRYYAAGSTSEVTSGGSDTYSGYDPYNGYSGFGDVGGSSGGGGGALDPGAPIEEPPIEEPLPEEIPEPGGPGGGHGNRRHQVQRIKRKSSRRIAKIKRGGVTTAERKRIQQIKHRRKTRIRKIRHRRR